MTIRLNTHATGSSQPFIKQLKQNTSATPHYQKHYIDALVLPYSQNNIKCYRWFGENILAMLSEDGNTKMAY